ncbi:hypothetical protein EIP86_002212 [Pleurotus ostreatoroseus]|nr:hypothetical protein EIP86_002212 [Pleurotus ostreatoroseus]
MLSNNTGGRDDATSIAGHGSRVNLIAIREPPLAPDRRAEASDVYSATSTVTPQSSVTRPGFAIAPEASSPAHGSKTALHAQDHNHTSHKPVADVESHNLDDCSLTAVSRLKSTLARMQSRDHFLDHLSARILRTLYASAKTQSQTRELTASEWSALVSIFGTLSLSTTQQVFRGLFAHPAAALMSQASKERTHWRFVVQLTVDKLQFHKNLSTSDRYWVMRARLTEVDLLDESGASSDRRDKLITQTREQYSHIGRVLSNHPDVHEPYLRALLRRPSPSHLGEVTQALSGLMKCRSRLHPRLWGVVWDVLTDPNLPAPFRDELVDGLRTLFGHGGVSDRAGGKLVGEALEEQSNDRRLEKLDYTCMDELPKALDHALRRASEPSDDANAIAISSWANHVVRSLMNAQSMSTDDIFKRLVLLHATQHLAGNDTVRRALSDMSAIITQDRQLDWEVACVLALLERVLHGDSKRVYVTPATAVAEPKQPLQVAKTLWRYWSSSPSLRVHEPLVPALVISSFFYIAGRSYDYDLVRDCAAYIGPMLGRSQDSPCHALAARHSTVEYALASITCGYSLEAVFRVVVGHIPDRQLLALVVADIIRRVSATDPLLAQQAISIARRMDVSVDGDLLTLVGTHLAEHGHIDALGHMQDSALNSAERSMLLKSILRSWRQPSVITSHRHNLHLTELIRSSSISHSMLKSVRAQLRSLVLALAIHGDSTLVLKLIRDVQTRDSSCISRSLLQAVARHLVRRRHIRSAKLLVRRHWHLSSSPKAGSAQQGSMVDSVLSSKRRAAVTLDSLKRPSGMDTVSDETQTAMCNTYLHQHLFYKASRHMRRVSRTMLALRRLVSKHNLLPDRITINILIKGLLLWTKGVDKDAVRALFDRMIQNGYPSGGLYPDGTTPFGGSKSSSNMNSSIVLPKVESAISFTRHVRPLYKMFITAMTARKDFEGAKVVARVLTAVKAEYVKECVRKFEEAIHTLDAAVSTSAIEIPQSTKRPKLGKSLYSTLAKYGIRKDPKPSSSTVSRADSIAKNAPHLVAILSRSTSRVRKPVSFKPGHPPSSTSSAQSPAAPGSDYRPSSTASFISRLATFKLTTYANKPTALDAVAAAKCGWINEGKDRLIEYFGGEATRVFGRNAQDWVSMEIQTVRW